MPQSKVDPDESLWAWLAHDVWFYRSKYRLSQTAMGEVMGTSFSNVSNIEANRRKITNEQAMALDLRFKTGGHFSRLLRFARLGHDPQWFQQYFDLEAKAELIKAFEAITVPGLLQTPEYAGELFLACGATPVEPLVKQRMSRQPIIGTATTWFLITETVIDWTIGGPEIMRKQLAHLLELSESPNLGIRVVPRNGGAHAGVDGSFSTLSGTFGDIAYTESPGGGRLVASSSEVRQYSTRYDRIGQVALPEAASREMIQSAMEAL